jgi:hypothetical protein
MTLLSPVKAQALSVPHIAKGVYNNANQVDQFLKVLEQHPIDGYELQIFEVAALPTPITEPAPTTPYGGYPLPYDALDPSGTPRTCGLVRIAGDIVIASSLLDIYRNPNDLRQLQVEAMKNAILASIGGLYISGSSDPVFHGLADLVDGSQTFDYGSWLGGGLLTAVDYLVDLIKAGDGLPDFLISSGIGIRAYAQACYDKGFAPETVRVQDFARPLIAHRGIPLLRDDLISSEPTTDIYAVTVGWERGVCGIYPAGGAGFDFKVEKILNPEADEERYRVATTCGLALFNTLALARLTGVSFEVES